MLMDGSLSGLCGLLAAGDTPWGKLRGSLVSLFTSASGVGGERRLQPHAGGTFGDVRGRTVRIGKSITGSPRGDTRDGGGIDDYDS